MEKNRFFTSTELGIPKHKIVIDIFEKSDKKYFEKAGFQVIEIEGFSIDLIPKKKHIKNDHKYILLQRN